MTDVLTLTHSAVLEAPHTFRHDDLPERALSPNEVRIRLEGCGVCGSDLAVWRGAPWFDYPLKPGAPGHEGWGTISEIGSNVTDFAIGDRVTALTYQAYAETDIASASDTVKLPASLNDIYFPGEPLGCAMNIFERSQVESGMRVAIVGIGFLGVLLTQLCASAGAEVIAISRRPYALEMARQFGAKKTIQLSDDLDAIVGQAGEEGCQVVIEATGKAQPLELASRLTGVRGRLVIAGYHQDGMREINMQLWNWRGIDVINAHERDPQRYISGIQRAIDAAVNQQFDLSPLYTVLPLSEIHRAFELMDTRPDGFMKALVLA